MCMFMYMYACVHSAAVSTPSCSLVHVLVSAVISRSHVYMHNYRCPYMFRHDAAAQGFDVANISHPQTQRLTINPYPPNPFLSNRKKKQRAEAAASPGRATLGVIDMSPLYQRPDAHALDDCLHFCTPGPLDLFGELLMAALSNGELE